MVLLELFDQFPDEKTCKLHLKKSREHLGICCKKCKLDDHFWIEKKEQWQCKNCAFRTTLKSGTMFQNTKMPLRVWFFTMGFMTLTKKGFSSKELQSQIGHKRYEPIWYMMHKIRRQMGRYNDNLKEKCGELGAKILTNLEDSTLQIGRGSNMQKVPLKIITGSELPSKGRKIRILQLRRADKSSIDSTNVNCQWPSYPIKNLERILNGIHHQVKDYYLQNYLNEFSFKFSLRHVKLDAFHALFYTGIQPFW